MTLAAVSTAFLVVFSIFLVSVVVVVALAIRFIVRRGKADRAAWLAAKEAEGGRHSDR